MPSPVKTALLLGGGSSALLGLWGFLAGQPLIALDGFVTAAIIALGYIFAVAKFGAGAREQDRLRTYRKAILGFSVEDGLLLLAYGFAGFVVILFVQLLQAFLGFPQASSLNGFFVIVVAAPLRETVLFSGVAWSLVFSAVPGSNGAKWIAATVVSGVLFALVWHAATYAGEASFAFVGLFIWHVVFSLIAWLPTFRGNRPSLIPVWIAHLLLNGFFYFATCVSTPQGLSALAARFCGI